MVGVSCVQGLPGLLEVERPRDGRVDLALGRAERLRDLLLLELDRPVDQVEVLRTHTAHDNTRHTSELVSR